MSLERRDGLKSLLWLAAIEHRSVWLTKLANATGTSASCLQTEIENTRGYEKQVVASPILPLNVSENFKSYLANYATNKQGLQKNNFRKEE
jgi:hypothetical protein